MIRQLGHVQHDLDANIAAHVAPSFDALAEELAADGQAAATRVDDAARALIDAYGERQGVEQRVFTLAGAIRNPRPGDVRRTRAEAVVAEAEKLLQAGGEAPPALLADPRQPRHGTVAAEFPEAVDAWT